MSDPKKIDWDKICKAFLDGRIYMTPQQWSEQYMTIFSPPRDGYYDENGRWQRTKFCFVYCGERCTCSPPLGTWEKNVSQPEEPLFIQPKDEDDKKGP